MMAQELLMIGFEGNQSLTILVPSYIFRGPLKFFSWMVIQKSKPRRGDAKLGGSGGMPAQKILRNLTLFWRLFVRFESLKFLSFNKVY